jgi:CDP-diacylglycerol---serine O-phosphatidyltransferase
VPRAIWRRRRTTDIPRPAGRRWARLRGSLARQMLVGGRVLVGRAGRRQRGDATATVVASVGAASAERMDGPTRRRRRLIGRRRASPTRATGLGYSLPASPVSPALPPAHRPSPAGHRPPASHGPTASSVPLSEVLPGYPRPGSPDGYPAPAEDTGPVRHIPLLPGHRTPLRRLKFALVTACTAASLVLGMVAVFLAIAGDLRLAALALLGCVVADGLDGGLARRLGVASPFGAQMDSLADLSSFGMATGVVVYQWLTGSGATVATAAPVCALVVVCAAIRLARFNVSPKDGRFFCGVPTTMTAAVLALAVLVLGPGLSPGMRLVAVAVYALAMVSSFPYAKLVRVLRLPPVLLVIPLAGAMVNVSGTFALVAGGYLVSGPMLWLRRRATA